jgi:hypothetical protein
VFLFYAAFCTCQLSPKRGPPVTNFHLNLEKSFPAVGLSSNHQENVMPQSPHDRIAELHNLAAHAHQSAATAHGKGDHLTAHELSVQAHEHSTNAHKLSQELAAKAGKP